MNLGAGIIVQHTAGFFVIWHNFSEVGRMSSVRRISLNLLNFSIAIHCRAWIIPANGKVIVSFTEHAGEVFPTCYQPCALSSWVQLNTSPPPILHRDTEACSSALRGWFVGTEFRMSLRCSGVASLTGISCIWRSEEQGSGRRHGLELEWNIYCVDVNRAWGSHIVALWSQPHEWSCMSWTSASCERN